MVKKVKKRILIVLLCIVGLTNPLTTQIAGTEIIFNDNINIDGELSITQEDCGITFSDNSRQTAAAKPSWHHSLPTSQRFELVLDNDEAVLDRTTGLVWQRDTDSEFKSWTNAMNSSWGITIGGRMGWRLPTIEELATLVDTSQDPALPNGHYFTNVKFGYWSSTVVANDPDQAWIVYLSDTPADTNDGKVMNVNKDNLYYVRAVRSGR